MKLGLLLWPAVCCVLFASSGNAMWGFGNTNPNGTLIPLEECTTKYSEPYDSNLSPDLAIDGDEDGECAIAQVNQASGGLWWEIDLGKQYWINYVRILPKKQGTAPPQASMAAFAANIDAATHHPLFYSPVTQQAYYGAVCNFNQVDLVLGEWYTFFCFRQNAARYVIIAYHPYHDTDTLTLCEVQIHGRPVPPEDNGKIQNVDINWAAGWAAWLKDQLEQQQQQQQQQNSPP